MAARTASPDALGLRFAAAVVLIPAAVAATLAGGWAFALLILIAALGLAWEWRAMAGGSLAFVGGATVAVWTVGVFASGTGALGIVALAAGLLAILGLALPGRRQLIWTALGTAYIGLPLVALLALRSRTGDGALSVLFLFAVVWATDTGAYFVGRAVGGAPLAPTWSPRKTRSGALGGLAAGLIVGSGAWIAGLAGALWPILVLALVLSVAAEIGDLFESFIKRHFHRKDSGRIIPGHGGLFDRLDSLLAAAPVMALVMAAGGADGWLLRGGA